MTSSGASTPATIRTEPRCVLLGRHCANTASVMSVLAQSGVELAAVVLAHAVPAAPPTSNSQTCPTYQVASPRETRRLLEELRPDVAIAACYPWRLSRRTRAAARHGVLNIHPSPLPYGRGPDPVFWVFRHGERTTGVTVHVMDDGLDTGPILAQQYLSVPEDCDAVLLEQRLFQLGASLLAAHLPAYLGGTSTLTPQDPAGGSYHPAPSALDWVMLPQLPAAWAWRFARGVAPLAGPLAVQTQGHMVPVRKPLDWGSEGLPPVDLPAGVVAARFQRGWVTFDVAP